LEHDEAIPIRPRRYCRAAAFDPRGALDEQTYQGEYRYQPHHCIFHKRHAPNAEAYFVRTKHDHWTTWGSNRARGSGQAIASMTGPTKVDITLSHPVSRCGHRVFSVARFTSPRFGTSNRLKIDVCTRRRAPTPDHLNGLH
jgi:hypothetical protein